MQQVFQLCDFQILMYISVNVKLQFNFTKTSSLLMANENEVNIVVM